MQIGLMPRTFPTKPKSTTGLRNFKFQMKNSGKKQKDDLEKSSELSEDTPVNDPLVLKKKSLFLKSNVDSSDSEQENPQ